MSNLVWVETRNGGIPIRIFKSYTAAMHLVCKGKAVNAVQMCYDDAVKAIRKQIFYRSKGFCELCSSIVLEQSGHMHEMKHRGRGGEISLSNSVFICPKCHQRQHRDRNPRFTRRQA